MSYTDPLTKLEVPYPLIRLPDGTLENPFSSANYGLDAAARLAVGEFKALPFANTTAYRAVWALNDHDALKVFSLGGRTAVGESLPNNSPPIIGVGGVPMQTQSGTQPGILDGEIFGIDVKLLALGLIAFLMLKK